MFQDLKNNNALKEVWEISWVALQEYWFTFSYHQQSSTPSYGLLIAPTKYDTDTLLKREHVSLAPLLLGEVKRGRHSIYLEDICIYLFPKCIVNLCRL